MTQINIEDIVEISRDMERGGYTILFANGQQIWMTKRRAIPALLILLKYGDGCEADLQRGSNRLPEIKRILEGRMPTNLIQDSYADANKPFSELWNEEGFVWIENTPGDRRLGSQRYVLHPEDHIRFFQGNVKKAKRQAPKISNKDSIRIRQDFRCNICGSKIVPSSKLIKNVFSRGRKREVFDHRVPVEKGGGSQQSNFQALCFYCNKSKWQICNICTEDSCQDCALAFPETHSIVKPTKEDISDRMFGSS